MASLANSFGIPYTSPYPSTTTTTTTSLFATNWDALIAEDEEDDLSFVGPPVPRDMRYNMFNINRQRENFEQIKAVGGVDLVNDIYVRDPDSTTFWYCGKVARVSDIPLEKAVSRQWSMRLVGAIRSEAESYLSNLCLSFRTITNLAISIAAKQPRMIQNIGIKFLRVAILASVRYRTSLFRQVVEVNIW